MEEWRNVVGHEDRYQVSSEGRVRSYPTKYHPRVTVLKPYIVVGGYLMVRLGLAARRTVHSLVAEAFIGSRPAGKVVCHIDGVPANNNKENLKYDTQSNNVLARNQHGTYRSELHGMAKLNACKVRTIRALLRRGDTPGDLSRRYNVTRELIYMIRDRKIWKEV